MSTNTPYASDPQSSTEITARGRADPWAAPDEASAFTADRAPRQFEPTCRKRLRNAVDQENAYAGQ